MSLLNLLSGVICMCRASLIFYSRFLLALSTILTSSHLVSDAAAKYVQQWLKTSRHLSYKHHDVFHSLLKPSSGFTYVYFTTTAGYTVHNG